MSKREAVEEFQLAMYLLNKRFNAPIDLIKYWSFTGPCIEPHPPLEDYNRK
jgi:hypothetical protein